MFDHESNLLTGCGHINAPLMHILMTTMAQMISCIVEGVTQSDKATDNYHPTMQLYSF